VRDAVSTLQPRVETLESHAFLSVLVASSEDPIMSKNLDGTGVNVRRSQARCRCSLSGTPQRSPGGSPEAPLRS
jgi:hypothetical protein